MLVFSSKLNTYSRLKHQFRKLNSLQIRYNTLVEKFLDKWKDHRSVNAVDQVRSSSQLNIASVDTIIPSIAGCMIVPEDVSGFRTLFWEQIMGCRGSLGPPLLQRRLEWSLKNKDRDLCRSSGWCLLLLRLPGICLQA